ncbi:hypothetical protein D3C86_1447570 [compost metagenome]
MPSKRYSWRVLTWRACMANSSTSTRSQAGDSAVSRPNACLATCAQPGRSRWAPSASAVATFRRINSKPSGDGAASPTTWRARALANNSGPRALKSSNSGRSTQPKSSPVKLITPGRWMTGSRCREATTSVPASGKCRSSASHSGCSSTTWKSSSIKQKSGWVSAIALPSPPPHAVPGKSRCSCSKRARMRGQSSRNRCRKKAGSASSGVS